MIKLKPQPIPHTRHAILYVIFSHAYNSNEELGSELLRVMDQVKPSKYIRHILQNNSV